VTSGAVSADAHARLHRRLKRELECSVERTERDTWITSSSLPHEIRVHVEAGVELVRVSAGMVMDAKPTKALLEQVNLLNAERAFTRRIVGDGKVIIVAEMPLASLRKGDLEQLISMVHCLARLDAPLLAAYGGRSVTDLPAALTPDVDRLVENWQDLLRASGTATIKELQVWLDNWAGCDCWIDRDDESVIVVLGTTGRATEYPFPLGELRDDVKYLQEENDDSEFE
jgi:hypothetical protein